MVLEWFGAKVCSREHAFHFSPGSLKTKGFQRNSPNFKGLENPRSLKTRRENFWKNDVSQTKSWLHVWYVRLSARKVDSTDTMDLTSFVSSHTSSFYKILARKLDKTWQNFEVKTKTKTAKVCSREHVSHLQHFIWALADWIPMSFKYQIFWRENFWKSG